MVEKEPARNSQHSIMDVVNRILSDNESEDMDRIAVVVMFKNNTRGAIFSNARSDAEMDGMFWQALNEQVNIAED